MNEKLGYESPALVEIGTLHDLTLQSFNKVGTECRQPGRPPHRGKSQSI